jgi:hypothetical protein
VRDALTRQLASALKAIFGDEIARARIPYCPADLKKSGMELALELLTTLRMSPACEMVGAINGNVPLPCEVVMPEKSESDAKEPQIGLSTVAGNSRSAKTTAATAEVQAEPGRDQVTGRFRKGFSGNRTGRRRSSITKETVGTLIQLYGSPLRFLMETMIDPDVKMEHRMKAAELALPYAAYEKPPLGHVVRNLIGGAASECPLRPRRPTSTGAIKFSLGHRLRMC